MFFSIHIIAYAISGNHGQKQFLFRAGYIAKDISFLTEFFFFFFGGTLQGFKTLEGLGELKLIDYF